MQKLNLRFTTFVVSRIDLDYEAQCKLLLKTSQDTQRSSCHISLTHDGKMGLSLLDPFQSPQMEIYMDQHEIRIINRHQKNYRVVPNNLMNREKFFFGMDFTMLELQSIFWGRKIKNKENHLTFSFKEEKPEYIYKEKGFEKIQVKIKKWLTYDGFFFPKLFTIMEPLQGSVLTLAITNFQPRQGMKLEKPPLPKGYRNLKEG